MPCGAMQCGDSWCGAYPCAACDRAFTAAVAVAMGNADPDGRLRFLLGLLGISLGKWFPLTTTGGGSPRARAGGNPFVDTGVAPTSMCSKLATSFRVGVVIILGLVACTLHRYLVVVVAGSTAVLVVASLLPPFRWLLHTGAIRHLHQILGVVHVGASPPYVFLSDGGHLDNLGVIELLKRRCVHVRANARHVLRLSCGAVPDASCVCPSKYAVAPDCRF